MEKQKAVILLKSCKWLANQLANSGIATDITTDEAFEALISFYTVMRAGLKDDGEVQNQAGFSPEDIMNLNQARFRRQDYDLNNVRTCFACRYLLRQMALKGSDYQLTEVNRQTLRDFGKLMEIHWIEKHHSRNKGILLTPDQITKLNGLLEQVKNEDLEQQNTKVSEP